MHGRYSDRVDLKDFVIIYDYSQVKLSVRGAEERPPTVHARAMGLCVLC